MNGPCRFFVASSKLFQNRLCSIGLPQTLSGYKPNPLIGADLQSLLDQKEMRVINRSLISFNEKQSPLLSLEQGSLGCLDLKLRHNCRPELM